jgi:hypothetical protein
MNLGTRTRLFALFLIFVAVSSLYGYVGAWGNSNPYYPGPGLSATSFGNAIQWEPSPLWLTSYVLCKCEVGIHHTRSGYLFLNASAESKYYLISTLLGLGFGVLTWLGTVLLLHARRKNVPLESRQV